MKNYFNFSVKAVALVAFIFFSFSPVFNSIRAESIKPSSFKVAIYENPPKIYTDSNGKVKGFWPDIIDYISQRQGWTIEYVPGTFDQGLDRLSNNEVDMMVDVGYSGGRADIYDFTTETAFINWASIYSSKDTEINSFADLNGKRISVLQGDIHYTGPLGIRALIRSFNFNATFVETNSYEDNMQAVINGTADFAVVNRVFGSYTQDKFNLKPTSLVFNPIELKFAFPKDTPKTAYLKETIDNELKDLKQNSDSIYYRSIISNLELPIQSMETTPLWLRPLLLSASLLALGMIIFIIFNKRYQSTLEKRVIEKTEQLRSSEIKFKELSDFLPQVVFVTDNQGIITYVNEITTKVFGYSDQELLSGFKLDKLFADHKYDSDEPQGVPQYLNEKIIDLEFTARRKDGSLFTAFLYCSPIDHGIKNGGTSGMIINLVD